MTVFKKPVMRLLAAAVCAVATFATQAAPVTATTLTPGTHNIVIHEDGGKYGRPLSSAAWFTFQAVAGTQIRLLASRSADSGDTCQLLYSGNVNGVDVDAVSFRRCRGLGIDGVSGAGLGLTFVAFNDDSGGNPDSLIEILAPSTGFYSLWVSDLFSDNVSATLEASFTAPASANAVPLPGTVPLMALGLGLFAVHQRGRRKRTVAD